jgi:cell division septation protein DedD
MQQRSKTKATRLASSQQAADNPMHMVQVGTFRAHHRASELLCPIRALGDSGFFRPDRGVDASTVYRIILGMPDTHGTQQPLSLAQQLIAAAAQLSRYQ